MWSAGLDLTCNGATTQDSGIVTAARKHETLLHVCTYHCDRQIDGRYAFDRERHCGENMSITASQLRNFAASSWSATGMALENVVVDR